MITDANSNISTINKAKMTAQAAAIDHNLTVLSNDDGIRAFLHRLSQQ